MVPPLGPAKSLATRVTSQPASVPVRSSTSILAGWSVASSLLWEAFTAGTAMLPSRVAVRTPEVVAKVNSAAGTAALVPPGVVTVIPTSPAPCAGEVALHVVVLAQLSALAATSPKWALVEPGTKPVPVMVTTSPPPVPPAVGLMELMAGTASWVNLSKALVVLGRRGSSRSGRPHRPPRPERWR